MHDMQYSQYVLCALYDMQHAKYEITQYSICAKYNIYKQYL